MNKPHTKLTEALVLETAKDRIVASTGNMQSLTKVITINGDLLTIWHEDNRIHAKPDEEVVIITEESHKLKDDGTPFLNYAIVPAAFAKKILERNASQTA